MAFLKKEKGCNDIFLDEIKFSMADDFKHFLLTKHGLVSNTAGKYLKNTKELLKIAEIYQKPLIDRLNHVRNIFLFACFTGYAFAEILALKRSDVFLGNDGRRRIRKSRKRNSTTRSLRKRPSNNRDQASHYSVRMGHLRPY